MKFAKKYNTGNGSANGAVAVPVDFAKLQKRESANFPKNENKNKLSKKKSKELYVLNADLLTQNSTCPIKSIVKKKFSESEVQDSLIAEDSTQSKAKKRNKSVSSSLDNELLVKKCKSEEMINKKDKKKKLFKESESVVNSVENSSEVHIKHTNIKSRNKDSIVDTIHGIQSDSSPKDTESIYLDSQPKNNHKKSSKQISLTPTTTTTIVKKPQDLTKLDDASFSKQSKNRKRRKFANLSLDTKVFVDKYKPQGVIHKNNTKKNSKKNGESMINFVDDFNEVTAKKSEHKNRIDFNNSEETLEDIEALNSSSQNIEVKKKQKKNRNIKSIKSQKEITQVIENQTEMSDTLATKYEDKQVKAIQESIENLNVGDNASTLISLLDDMKVAEKKDQKKKKKNAIKEAEEKCREKIVIAENGRINKNKPKKNKKKNSNVVTSPDQPIKPKWQKKWNRDRRIEFVEEDVPKSIIIDNIPLKVIELYPSQEPMPVFTTTILYQNADSAEQALEEDNMVVGEIRVRVRRMPPTSETGVVVRSYRPCCEQTVSSIFAPCGRVRNIKVVAKGNKANISTAFVEFDSADAVERALKMAGEATIGGKRILISRFEYRTRRGDAPRAGGALGAGDGSRAAPQVPVLRMADVNSDTEESEEE